MIVNEINKVNNKTHKSFDDHLYELVKTAVNDALKDGVNPTSEYINVQQAMQILGIKRTKLHHLTSQGAFKTYKVGRELRYKRSEVINYVESQFAD